LNLPAPIKDLIGAGFVSRIGPLLASEGRMVAEMPKNMAIRPQILLFRDVAAVAAQWRGD
jgi:hypothetical protein